MSPFLGNLYVPILGGELMTRVEGSLDPDPVGRRTRSCFAPRTLLGVHTQLQEAKEGGARVISMAITGIIAIVVNALESSSCGRHKRSTVEASAPSRRCPKALMLSE